MAVAGLIGGGAWTGSLAAITAAVGLVLMIVGAGLLGRGLMDLGRNLTPVPHPRDDSRLVVSGVYALVRHPIYGGLMATAVGWALVAASPLALLLSALLVGFFELKSRREEVWLCERYAGYPAYAANTKRFFPRVY